MIVINLTDEVIEDQLKKAFSKMEPTPRKFDDGSAIKLPPIMHKIEHEVRIGKSLWLIMCMLYEVIFQELKNREIIVYNQKNDVWQGVDYHDD